MHSADEAWLEPGQWIEAESSSDSEPPPEPFALARPPVKKPTITVYRGLTPAARLSLIHI